MKTENQNSNDAVFTMHPLSSFTEKSSRSQDIEICQNSCCRPVFAKMYVIYYWHFGQNSLQYRLIRLQKLLFKSQKVIKKIII